MSRRHVQDVKRTLEAFAEMIGPEKQLAYLTEEDYSAWRASVAKTNGAVSVDNYLRRMKAFLNYAKELKIIAELPRLALKKPSQKSLRKCRNERVPQLFTPEELKRMLTYAEPTLRAMILLGLQAGLGNADCALLQTKHIKGAWVVYPRSKTEVMRRIPLWKVTQEALAAVVRPGDEYVFRTKKGALWTPKGKSETTSPISHKFTKFLHDLGIQEGRGFYALRHTFATVGGNAGDRDAVEAMMGHAPRANDMAATYREGISDARLIRVVKHIQKWLGGVPTYWADRQPKPLPFVSLDISHLQDEQLVK